MSAELVLVTGGTRSGKSGVAEALLADATEVTYIATGVAVTLTGDPEMATRIKAHRTRRPAGWRTVETSDIGEALAEAQGDVLIDSIGTWVQARMDQLELWEDGELGVLAAEARAWARLARGRVVVVAEQVGEGLVSMTLPSRRWVDAVGEVTAALSAMADRALLVVAGRAVELPAADPAPGRPDETASAGQAAASGQVAVVEEGEALRRHGDRMVPDGALDLAVNVRPGRPPAHVRKALDAAAVGRYPDAAEAAVMVAAHAGLTSDHVVLLAGAAEAFWLVPHALQPSQAAVVHPMFTAAEAALRACDVPLTRVPRDAGDGWRLRPDRVPDDADLVVLSNPNNPTGTLDEPGEIASLCRRGRIVVVDEAFMDFVTDERSSLLGRVDRPGLVVIRSVTKLWSIPGVRAGYLTADPEIAARLRRHQQPWPVSSAGLAAIVAALSDEAWRQDTATGMAQRRRAMVRRLGRIDGITVHDGAANFVLLEVPAGPAVHRALLARGIAVRPSTFPLLPPRYLRVAVADPAATERLAKALEEIL